MIGLPVFGEFGELGFFGGFGGRSLVGEELLLDGFGFGGGIGSDGFGVGLVEEGALFNGGVAAGLGDGGVVGFVVSVATVADEVDDDVGVEALAVLGGDSGDAHGRVGVFAVDVEDGDGQALGEVGGKAGGVRLVGVGGEAEEVVGDDVQGAADVVAGERGHVERLGGDALAGEGCVAVKDDGEDVLRALFADADLPGAGAAHDDGVHGFEVAWIGGEVERDGLAGGRGVLAGGSGVVLDVAAAKDAAWVDVFELGEDLGGGAADGVGHDVEAAAMRHGEDRAGDARCRCGSEDLIEERDEDGEAFEGEALGAEIALLDDLLEEVGADELRQDVWLIRLGRGALDLLLQPLALLERRDVHVLDGEVAAVVGAGFGGDVALGDVGDGEGFGREELA